MTELADVTLAGWHAAITAALKAHDIEAVPQLLALMAVNGYPREAEDLRQLMLATPREAKP